MWTLDIEAQLLRNGLPLTRPTRWGRGLGDFRRMNELAVLKMFPGSISNGEQVTLTVINTSGYSDDRSWIQVQSLIAVDGIAWPEPMPGSVYVNPWGAGAWHEWSSIVSFPIMSHLPTLEGTHTLLLRTVWCRRVER